MRRALYVAATVLWACWYPGDRGILLEEKVGKLSDENAALRKDLAESQEKLAKTQKRLDDQIEQLDKAARRSDADIGLQVQRTVEDVAVLRGQVETYQHTISQLETALKTAQDAMDKRVVAADPDAAAKKKADEVKRPDEPKDFLRLADDTAKGGDKQLARTLYNEYLKKWPKDAGAGEAHFGLGETYYTDEKCREALYEYGKVIQEFTKTRSAPDAYLRSADCFKKLKMVAESKLALETLVKEHPKSDAAKTAKVKLAELDDKPKKGKK
ncbi:MAG: tetratricopeptide repeat protein [Myxococcaceae bacterium]|nr:tetratricopeptide repeat protein [Myxococcaceae bacterium]